MELLGPGEAAVTRVLPDTRDQMLPHVRMAGPHRPLIWARVDADEMPPKPINRNPQLKVESNPKHSN
jgi:hypothetical protein